MIITLFDRYKESDLINKMWVAARTCYSADNIRDLKIEAENLTIEEKLDLIKKVFRSGHLSIAEHISFTFGISGISRSCSHQLVRHRLCTFSQQSQRYTDLSKEKIDWIIPDSIQKDEYALAYFQEALKAIEKAYCYSVEVGIKAEDARFILPNACPTNITVTTNLRNLMHIMGLRLCSRAQWEIRKVFVEMQKQIIEQYPFLKEYIQPQCVHLGYCPEKSTCGKSITKEQILKIVNLHNKSEIL